MVGSRRLYAIVFFIMAAVIVLNLGLALNFLVASGRALMATFSSEGIFLFAGVELAAVLLAYVVYKQKTSQAKP